MALTNIEKTRLDENVERVIETIIKGGLERVSLRDFETMLNQAGWVNSYSISVTSLNSSIKRVLSRKKDVDIKYYGATFTYAPHYAIDCGYVIKTSDISFTKEKNILHLDELYPNLTYDFITKEYNIPLEKFCTKAKKELNHYKKDYFCYEWMFNYTQKLSQIRSVVAYLPRELYTTMPKNFAKALETEPFSSELIRKSVYTNKYGKYYDMASSIIDDEVGMKELDVFLKICSFENLFKLIKNTYLKGRAVQFYDISNFVRDVNDYDGVINFTIDTNRDFYKNYSDFRNLLEQNKNDVLAKKLQRLNFINGLKIDEYTVVVPQSQEEKQAEGRMQNNCVGSFYDDSIIHGDNLIYFLRKTENVNHSYMTCRYNLLNKDTVEYRLKNNRSVLEEKDIEVVKKVSEIIRKNLGL